MSACCYLPAVQRIEKNQRPLQFTRKRGNPVPSNLIGKVLHLHPDMLPIGKRIADLDLQIRGPLGHLAQDQFTEKRLKTLFTLGKDKIPAPQPQRATQPATDLGIGNPEFIEAQLATGPKRVGKVSGER